MLCTDLYARQPGVGEGSGEERLPQICFCGVETHRHGRRIFLNVEPHLEEKLVKGICCILKGNDTRFDAI